MDQHWFEIQDIRRRKFNTAVWIPVHAAKFEPLGKLGTLGYKQEFFGAGSIAVPLANRTRAKALGWMEIGLRRTHKGRMTEGRYVPAEVFDGHELELNAVALVLVQEGNSDDPDEWHLNQDFVIALGLKREGDAWLAMEEGYIEVARLKRDHKRLPILLEIRAEHLKDYLCARGMAL